MTRRKEDESTCHLEQAGGRKRLTTCSYKFLAINWSTSSMTRYRTCSPLKPLPSNAKSSLILAGVPTTMVGASERCSSIQPVLLGLAGPVQSEERTLSGVARSRTLQCKGESEVRNCRV